MSLVIAGDSTHVTTPLSATITSLANNGSGLVRATTSAAHLFGSGDWLNVSTGVIAGKFQITVIDATHFDLIGSTFTATGTGTATDLSLTPQIQFPTDGDTFSAQLSGLLSASQALCDRTQYLAEQVGAYSVATVLFSTRDENPPSYTGYGTMTGSALGVAWQPLMVSGVALQWTITNLLAQDTILLDFTTSASQNFNANALVSLSYDAIAAGGSAGTMTKVGGSGQLLPWSGANPTGLHLRGVVKPTNFGSSAILGGSLVVGVQAYMPATSADIITAYSDYSFTATVLRA